MFELVEDAGQEAISSRWVVWEKDDGETRARLVARGYEEKTELQTDSPTVDKSCVRLLCTIAQSYKWVVKSMDV